MFFHVECTSMENTLSMILLTCFCRHDQAQRRLQRLEETVKLLEQQLKEKRDQIAVYVTTLAMYCLVSARARVVILCTTVG